MHVLCNSSKKPQKQHFRTVSEALLIGAEREGFSEASEMLLFRHLIVTFQKPLTKMLL